MRLIRSLLVPALALLLVPFVALAPAPASAASAATITGVAVDANGNPLPFVNWEIYYKRPGQTTWQTYQFGPKVTDAQGRFTYAYGTLNTQYRVCFYDSYYGQADTPSGFWHPEVRHRDRCWPNAGTLAGARTWTATASAPAKTFKVTLPVQGLGMAAVDPFLDGSFRPGETLKVVGEEGWRPTNATFTYQWMSSGAGGTYAPIPGATSASFTPTAAHEGKWVFAQVTGRRDGYKPATLTSPVSQVGNAHAVPTSPLTVTGTAAPGNTLTASFGKPSNTYSEIRWFVDGVPQPKSTTYDGATSKFVVAAAHSGARVEARLRMYRTDAGGNYIDGSDFFARVAKQVSGKRPAEKLPAATAPSGTPTLGTTLVAPRASADPGAKVKKYQWVRGSTKIKGATSKKYRLRAADLNKSVKVRITLTRPGWWGTYVKTSKAKVAKRAMTRGSLKVTGKARVGKRLTAKAKGWGPKPVKVKFQWLRNGKAIRKATHATYRPKKADRGTKVRVRITVKKRNHLTVKKVSKPVKIKR